ncbi:hypothetical protein, partial [Chryseobacterium sp. CH1]|uniref:hypothetical protein n=1 Tax=Chryseobacterium sp. CH1 TaxID=713551 RepID=UPI0010265902
SLQAMQTLQKINTIQPNNLSTLFSLASINSRRGKCIQCQGLSSADYQVDSLNFSAYKQLASYADTPENQYYSAQ